MPDQEPDLVWHCYLPSGRVVHSAGLLAMTKPLFDIGQGSVASSRVLGCDQLPQQRHRLWRCRVMQCDAQMQVIFFAFGMTSANLLSTSGFGSGRAISCGQGNIQNQAIPALLLSSTS
jgi:hypothetical protein